MLRRHASNPILTRDSIPGADPSAVFNPGAIYYDGRFHLLLRVQTRGRRTEWRHAVADDGVRFAVDPAPVAIDGLDRLPAIPHHIYDPRITLIDERIYVLAALDFDADCRLGLFSSDDLRRFECVGLASEDANRNGVLFPRKIGGRYCRLDRPNRTHRSDRPPTGDAIALSVSDDLLNWRTEGLVAEGQPRLWDELIGPGPPPLLTDHGWLLLYHGIATHPGALNIYQAGVLLLDRDNPAKVIGRSPENILEPREPYETVGQVPNVVFPSGWIVEPGKCSDPAADDALLYIYYGAADTVVALATATVGELIEACT